MINKLAQHYNVWKLFNTYVYRKTLTSENVLHNGNERWLEQVFKITTDGSPLPEEKPVGMKCIFLEKSGTRYILPTRWQKQLPLNVSESFDCFLKKSDTTIYKFITEPKTARIDGEKTLGFKDFIDVFNPMSHSNPKTWTFLKIQAIASIAKGGKYRLSGEPENGKNANDTIIGLINNSVVRIAKPTLAKLETLFYYNQKILPDEMTSLTPSQVRDVEPFFLNMGDESPTLNKHSMAQNKDLNEIDLTMSSCVFTYNNVWNLTQGSKFFDDIWQSIDAFNSRYPAFLLKGHITDSLPKLSIPQAQVILNENLEQLKQIAKNVIYYKDNMHNELHHYSREKTLLRRRHLVNFESVLDALDVYSDTQEEFNEWLTWVNERNKDYKNMIQGRGRIELQDDVETPFMEYEDVKGD